MKKQFLIIILSLIFFPSMSQVNISTIENLVFQGVGTRAVALVGALQSLSDNGITNNIQRVGGVSSGSIIALLYSLGYSSEEMRKILFEIDFASLEDKPCIFRIKKKFGYYKGRRLEKLLKRYVNNSKFDLDSNATFSDLNKQNKTELYIFSANLNTFSIEEFSYRKTPNVKLWEAVRASISIPVAFPAWKFTQGVENEHLYVDGGVVYDFPINFFDGLPFNTSGEQINNKTLGFIIDNQALDREEITLDYGSSLGRYFRAVYQTIVDGQLSVIEIDPKEANRIVSIEIDGDTAFSLTNAQKQDLYDRGFKYTNLFLKNNGKEK